MTESIVERLRAGPAPSQDVSSHLRKYQALCDEAAAEIDRLTAERGAARAEVERLRDAGQNLIDDVRRRYPGEELRCQYMRALDAALQPTPASWGAAGVQMTITEPEGSHE